MGREREADRQLVETIKNELEYSAARFLELTSEAMLAMSSEDPFLAKFWRDGAAQIKNIRTEDWG